ncbi:MAG: hypothetical protein A2Y54_02680 [Chloroflexi bacterium RBG_16_51_16]|nr:MAG: hypothetical protein A2Y54_02680 [Chloroflexi bacterium RBG_16_51_16]
MKFNLRNVFLVNAVLAFALALGFLLGPDTLLRLYGLSSDKTQILLAQLFGTSLVTIGMVAWFGSTMVDNLKARDAMAITLFITNTIFFVITLLGTLGRTIRVAAWPTVILFLAFALSYGYLQFIKQGE